MKLLSLILMLAFLTAVTLPAFADDKVSDDRIHDDVMKRLASDRDVKGGGIQVEVASGVVTLRGHVTEAKQKERAERLAKKVKGVKQVVNELKVELGVAPAAETER